MKIHQSRSPIADTPGRHHFYETYTYNLWAEQNPFRTQAPSPLSTPLPEFATSKDLLPEPHWEGHSEVVDCYWATWKMAFTKFRRATEQNRFLSDFASTAFNDATFMWDSAFISIFWRYGRKVWNGLGTLDNFYGKQHPDGFICREIYEGSGMDAHQRHDPSSTGPNVFPWIEWDHYCNSGDLDRLRAVYPALAAYTLWTERHRTWQDGSYWSSGWGTGMDNQPRHHAVYHNATDFIPDAIHIWYEHGHLTWVDASFHAVLAYRVLARMAELLGRTDEVGPFIAEADRLTDWINAHLWDEQTAFYHDRRRDGSLVNNLKTIGSFWALLADAVPPARSEIFLSHLTNKDHFGRAHLVPSMSGDSYGFEPDGGYWRGAIWPPTNYMILRGLTAQGQDDLAAHVARNHVDNVVAAWQKTGTFWENYAPDFFGEGRSTPDFVGWSGVPPIAVFIEYVLGLRPQFPKEQLLWDVRLTEAHGVKRYPFGNNGLLDLSCAARASAQERPQVTILSNVALSLLLRWEGGSEELLIPASS